MRRPEPPLGGRPHGSPTSAARPEPGARIVARIRNLVRAGNPIHGREVRRFLRRKSYPQSEPFVNCARL